MAIQIRRGSNAEWETNNSNIVVGEPAVATDSKRAFIGTASGAYMELANLEAIAPAYDPGNSYMIDDYVSYQGKLHVCTVPTSGAWNASAWQVTTLGQALAENAYSNYETYTMNGDIVSFPNGAGGVPLKDLTLDIEAVQDLHGYDHPWVGGAGKNLLKVTNFSVGQTKSVNGVDFTYNSDGSFTINGTSSTNNNFVNLNYTANTITIPYGVSANIGFYASSANSNVILQWSTPTGQPVSLPCSSSGFNISADTTATLGSNNSSWLRIQIPTSGTTVNNLKIYPFWCLSSNKLTQYEPYENICPIVGWDEVNVTRTGKNLWGGIELKKLNGFNNRSSSTTDWSSDKIRVNGGSPITLTIYENPNYIGGSIGLSEYDANGTYISSYTIVNPQSSTTYPYTNTRTLNANTEWIYIRGYRSGGNSPINDVVAQLELGSTATAYEPYNGQTYTTDLDGTRYGGTLDVTTGVLTVTWKSVDMGNISWTQDSSPNQAFFSGTNLTDRKYGTAVVAISSAYKFYGNNTSSGLFSNMNNGEFGFYQTSTTIKVKDSRYANASDFQTGVVGQTIVYELATPQTVQLTPTQVQTLLGQNNIWADSGKVEVTYRISKVL